MITHGLSVAQASCPTSRHPLHHVITQGFMAAQTGLCGAGFFLSTALPTSLPHPSAGQWSWSITSCYPQSWPCGRLLRSCRTATRGHFHQAQGSSFPQAWGSSKASAIYQGPGPAMGRAEFGSFWQIQSRQPGEAGCLTRSVPTLPRASVLRPLR